MPQPETANMSPRKVAEAMYTALLQSDRDALQAITSPDIEIHVTEELAYGGGYEGLPGFAALFKNTFERIDSTIEIQQLFDAGHQVVAVGRTRGTARSTGLPFDAALVHVLTVENGKIKGFDAFVEDSPIMAAITGNIPEA
jgi:ketosteroid isomerase-like protein